MHALKVFHSHKICSDCQVIVPLLLFPIVKKKNHVIDLQYTAFLYTLVLIQLHCYRTYKTAHPIPLKRHFTNLWIKNLQHIVPKEYVCYTLLVLLLLYAL